MTNNRRRDTAPELAVRSALHAAGFRYRVDVPLSFDRRRRADIVFGRVTLAVFIDGCFWHGCPEHYSTPVTNADYWATKVQRNRLRDTDTDQRLRDSGWRVLRYWEHQDPNGVAADIARHVAAWRAGDML